MTVVIEDFIWVVEFSIPDAHGGHFWSALEGDARARYIETVNDFPQANVNLYKVPWDEITEAITNHIDAAAWDDMHGWDKVDSHAAATPESLPIEWEELRYGDDTSELYIEMQQGVEYWPYVIKRNGLGAWIVKEAGSIGSATIGRVYSETKGDDVMPVYSAESDAATVVGERKSLEEAIKLLILTAQGEI